MMCISQVSVRLAQFHNNVKKVVREACENALIAEGFVPDPIDLGKLHYYITVLTMTIYGTDKNSANMDLDGKPISLDVKDKQTYTMQASKRSHCQRLTR